MTDWGDAILNERARPRTYPLPPDTAAIFTPAGYAEAPLARLFAAIAASAQAALFHYVPKEGGK